MEVSCIKNPCISRGLGIGGEGGIRTLDTLLTYTPLAGERLQPLGHLSGAAHCNVKVPVVVDEIWVLSGDFRGKI